MTTAEYLATGDPVASLVDERTMRLVDGRLGSTDMIARRGWLMRRMLLAADMFGLTLTFIVVAASEQYHGGQVFSLSDYAVLTLVLPTWVIGAKLYGLYERDEERANHSTFDDLIGVLHLVTAGAWILFIGMRYAGNSDLAVGGIATFWLSTIILVPTARR
jgi:hypothetical protein